MYGVMQPMLKFGMLCHYSIKIIFFGYSKNAISRNCERLMATCGMSVTTRNEASIMSTALQTGKRITDIVRNR